MTSNSTKPKRRWWRLLTQFSLRTLLVLTTLAAIGCWWFLQPEAREEELAGPYLKLRRQVRVRALTPEEAAADLQEEDFVVNTGFWLVRDQFGDLLIDGHYLNDQPHGKWTIYHTSGNKAAEGPVMFGIRTGLWRTWDEQGTLRSETTYKTVDSTFLPKRLLPVPVPCVNSATPILGGMINLRLAQFGGGLGGGMMGGGGPVPPAIGWQYSHVAIRHGPAKVWHANGKLHIDGVYLDDLRDGPWTFYDEQGHVSEQGDYRGDRREGTWTTREGTCEYIAGLRKPEHNQLLITQGPQLTTGSIHRKIAAAQRLEQLGPTAVPCLAGALLSDDPETQLLALRALGRLKGLPETSVARVAQLSESPDARLALRAKLVVYLTRPGERPRLFAPLVTALEKADDALATEALLAMYRTDADRQLPILGMLVERMGRVEIAYQGRWNNAPGYSRQIVNLGWDVVPKLDAIYPQVCSEARWFSVCVVQGLMAWRGPTYVETSAGIKVVPWEMPDAAKALLERAKLDSDPRVREAAEASGRQMGGFF